SLHFDDDAHAVAIAFVANVADALNFLVLHQVGDVRDQARLVHLIGQLGDDDVLALFASLLDGGFRAHLKCSAARFVRLLDSVASVDVASRRKIGTGHKFHNFFQIRFRIVDQRYGRFDNFLQIVRRDVCGHANGDATGTVDEQAGNSGGQNGRLAGALVEIGNEI